MESQIIIFVTVAPKTLAAFPVASPATSTPGCICALHVCRSDSGTSLSTQIEPHASSDKLKLKPCQVAGVRVMALGHTT